MRRDAAACALAAVACALAAAGCSTDEPADESRLSADPSAPSAERPRPSTQRPPNRPASPPPRATCPAGASNCRTASGRVIYVERVDPDGDGDAHFVLASRDSITGPGISVIDVKRSLRPSPLPGRGDRVTAAGPVYRGSYGQRQIEATELHVAR